MKSFSLLLLLALSLFSRGQNTPADLAASAQRTLAVVSGKLKAPGLQQPVDVLRDRWGVPHIYALNEHDLFFAQGFVAAQDRLFQMEMWKRSGQGRPPEALGPSALQRAETA